MTLTMRFTNFIVRGYRLTHLGDNGNKVCCSSPSLPEQRKEKIMGIRITGDEGKTALYDSVSGFAFGLVFDNSEEANDFLEFAGKNEPRDLRVLSDSELEKLYCKWVNQ